MSANASDAPATAHILVRRESAALRLDRFDLERFAMGCATTMHQFRTPIKAWLCNRNLAVIPDSCRCSGANFDNNYSYTQELFVGESPRPPLGRLH
jgi:hypothetical protein